MITVNRTRVGGIGIFDIRGRLDSINVEEVRVPLIQAAEDGNYSHIILNMSGVDYLSAAGLRVLRELDDKIHGIHIASPSGRVQ